MRQEFRAIGSKARAFATDRRGNFAVLTAAAASVLALAVGFGVNLAQVYNIKSGLRSALDAAVTSTARDLTTGKIDPKDARARFEAFFFANADPELSPADRTVLDTLVVDQAGKTVTATRMSIRTCSSRCSPAVPPSASPRSPPRSIQTRRSKLR